MSGWDGVGTTPISDNQYPISTIEVEVVEGPDKGKRAIAKEDTLTIGVGDGNDLILSDSTVSRFHVELSQHRKGILVHDHESTNGTLVGDVRIEKGVIKPGATLKLGRTKITVLEGKAATVPMLPADHLHRLRGQTPVMRRLMARIDSAAKAGASVLLIGESGTGKELIAEAVHALSERAKGPLVTVDCASLAPTLVASDLFGHERGAFTGAHKRHIGAFERANGGTIFLDEIGELPPDLQTTLLGVLERRRFRRLGGSEEISVDVRVVAATHRDLRAQVNSGRFRLDLYYRIAVITLQVPALRERADDIPLLINNFTEQLGYVGSLHDLFSQKALEQMLEYHWPGNVRELRNAVEVALALGEESALEGREPVGTLPSEGRKALLEPLMGVPYGDARAELLEQFESLYLTSLLERADNNVSKAARMAKMDRSHLTTLLKRRGLR